MRPLSSGLLLFSLLVASACGAPGTVVSDTPAPAPAPAPSSPEAPAAKGEPPAPPAASGDAGTPPPPVPTPGPATTFAVETMTFGDDARQVGLTVPVEIPAGKPLALVLAFHGDGGDGPSLRDTLDIGAYAKGEAVIAYPTSKEFGWDLTLPAAANKDLPWVEALVASLSATYPIDAQRVFAAGYSKGAFFSDQIACARSGFLRGVAVHAGGAPYDPDGAVGRYPNGYVQCDPAQTGTAALIVHGESDGTVPFGSGEYATKYWSFVNGCGGDEVAWFGEKCQAQVGCPTALPVAFCPVEGLDHVLWSRAAEVSWAFFSKL